MTHSNQATQQIRTEMVRTVHSFPATSPVTLDGTMFRATYGNDTLSALNQSAHAQVNFLKNYIYLSIWLFTKEEPILNNFWALEFGYIN